MTGRALASSLAGARGFAAAAIAVVAAGIWFRISGAFTTPLWNDEARQALALGGDFDLDTLAAWPLNLRPVLYLLIGKLSILAHDAEWVLRLPSLVPSIAALFATLGLARLLFTSRGAVLVCLICVSLDPWLIDYAKEYKPYALEHFLITWQAYLLFAWLRRRSTRSLRALLVVAALSPLLGFACVFVEPFVFLILAIDARRGGDRPALAIIAAAGAAALALFTAQYVLFQQHATKMSFQYWWTNFYDTEFRFSRLGDHLYDITGRFPAGPVYWSGWQGPAAFLAALNVVLFALGLAALVARRRWQLLVLVAGPLLLPIAASFAGRWPYGMVRVNLYMIGLVVLAWGAAVEHAATSKPLRGAGLAIAGLLAALQLPIAPRTLLDKQIPTAYVGPTLKALDMPALLEALLEADPGERVCVHVSAEARPVFLYYTEHRAGSAAVAERLRIGRMLSENTRYTMLEMSAALRGEAQPCWLIRSYKYDEQLAARRVLKEPGFRALAEIEAPGLFATKLERTIAPLGEAGDGSITLRAEDAVLEGDGLWFYGRPRIGGLQGVDPRWAAEAVGNWTSTRQVVRWSFDVARASELEVLVTQAAGEGARPSEYVVAIDGQTLAGTVRPTPTWRDFGVVRLGAIRLEPGRHTASVRATVRRGEYIMNLRSLTLAPRRGADMR